VSGRIASANQAIRHCGESEVPTVDEVAERGVNGKPRFKRDRTARWTGTILTWKPPFIYAGRLLPVGGKGE
jgi:hypothetical protein